MKRAAHSLWLWVLLAAGCGGAAPGPTGTGAEAAVRAYFEALVRRDWAKAYAALDPASRAQCGAAEFTRRAQVHRRGLGFEPEAVGVRSCEEHGQEAVAHVVLTGRGAGRPRSSKDGAMLRRRGSGWGVVLTPRFGRER